ncbi:DNA polymerase-3 subunit delta' [Sphingomonas guangdongensis]|uniref:DNA polymerase-3 subunit delta n=1 Tax=Sphingomonas guangdongensis TaxID=1141890 RepID=A0A285R658_9SPHN|nr:DNA polymerase III subunit delta' [Sphingomonas guangdongensis]SOB87852.1 DNA polymerase-3 subunit delta' [Sphingomonas guangdongensis]
MTSLVGNGMARAAFDAALAHGALHHAWLIAGPEGVGKARFALDAATRMLAQASGAAERTQAMIAAGSHPDLRVLTRKPKDENKPDSDLARSIKIDQVRALQPLLATKPSMSERRVIVIDAVDDLERPGASNALLKNLEEPPAGTIFLLVSHAPGRLLPTIRSRCRLLRFDPLSDEEVREVLAGQVPDATPAEIAALVRAAGGSPGRALRFAGLQLAVLEDDLAAIARDGDPSNRRRVKLAKALGTKAAQPRYEAFLERVPAFIAEQAGRLTGPALRDALEAYDAARGLAAVSLAQSLDAGTTAFELGGLVARLAKRS